jgi:hypothetical protein
LQSNQSELTAILGRLDGALLTASVTVSALRETTDAPAAVEAPAYVPVPAPAPTQMVVRPAPQAAPVAQRPAPVAQRPVAPQAAPAAQRAAVPSRPVPQQSVAAVAAAAPAPVPAPAKPAPKKAKAVLRADTLAERLEMNQVRPADGQPLMVQASAARPAQQGVRHRAAADELMSVMRNLRKG